MTFRFLTGMRLWIPYLSVSLFFLFCLQYEANAGKQKRRKPKKKVSHCDLTVSQGVKGYIRFLAGNQMPSPDRPANPGTGVSREIGIFEATRETDVVKGRASGFYKKIKTKRIIKFWSNNQGCFAAALMPGRYSILVKEEGQWYANQFDGEGYIFPFEVKEGEVTQLNFRISHKAAF